MRNPQESDRYEGEPLSPARLAAIWKGLSESERFGFILSLDEQIADQVMAATVRFAQESPPTHQGVRRA